MHSIKFRHRIAPKLLVASAFAVLPVLLYLWSISTHELVQELEKRRVGLTTTIRTINENFIMRVNQSELLLHSLAQRRIFQNLDTIDCQPELAKHFSAMDNIFTNLLIVDASGQIVCNAKSPNLKHDLSDKLHFQRAIKTQRFAVGEFSVSKLTANPVIGMMFPMLENGQVKMLTATSLELDVIFKDIEQTVFGTDFEISMIDTQGKVLTHWQKTGKIMPPGTDVSQTSLGGILLSKPTEPFFEAPDLFGNPSFFTYQPMIYNGEVFGYLALSYHMFDVEHDVKQHSYQQMLAVSLLFFLGLILSSLVIQRLIGRRLSSMMQLVKRLEKGELGATIPVHDSQDELALLSRRINTMSGQLRQQQQGLLDLAYKDRITQLDNKHYWQEQVEARLADPSSVTLDLVILNIDYFRLINDSVGHDLGDQLLKVLAQRLTTLSTSVQLLSHLGADEFAFALINQSPEQLYAFVASVHRLFERPFRINEQEFVLTASMGSASYPEDADSFVTLFQNANAALHKSKQEGRNQCSYFTESMKLQVMRRLLLENALRVALTSTNQLMLYYQPQVDVRGNVSHFEALIRWRHPQLGMISPAELIPLAEKSSLIIMLGRWVLNQACAQMRQWIDEQWHIDYVSINVSAVQLHMSDLVNDVKLALEKHGLEPHQLELEVTESFVIMYPEQAIESLTQLKLLGVRLAMDDFGTGYSSLLYLKRMPLDCIKVDQGFVRDMLIDPHDVAIVQAVIALGHSFSLTVVAEGVETPEHAERLRVLGCELLQGYLFSRPVPAEQAVSFLQKLEQ